MVPDRQAKYDTTARQNADARASRDKREKETVGYSSMNTGEQDVYDADLLKWMNEKYQKC